MNHDWMLDEIATGLQKLYLLSLDRTPAAELLTGTAQSWLEALTEGREWDEQRDTQRIREAFVTLARTREQWPAPRHFLDVLPHVQQQRLGYEVKPASKEEAAAAMARIRQMLDEQMPSFKPRPKAKPSAGLAAYEAELREHYADRKSAAAGGDA